MKPAASAASATAAPGDPIEALASVTSTLGLGDDYRLLRPLPLVLPLNREGGASGPAGTQLTNEIEPFTPLPPDTVLSAAERRGADVVFAVNAPDCTGRVTIRPTGRPGEFEVAYRLEMLKAVNPRQWGVVFTLPRTFDTLTWARDAQWSWYPDDHIGRPTGTARANPVARRTS